MHPGQLAAIDHPLISDVARVEEVGFAMNDSGARLRFRCRLLPCSAGLAT